MKIKMIGAAGGEVTGSAYMIQTAKTTISRFSRSWAADYCLGRSETIVFEGLYLRLLRPSAREVGSAFRSNGSDRLTPALSGGALETH